MQVTMSSTPNLLISFVVKNGTESDVDIFFDEVYLIDVKDMEE
jgi:hypothetical protein